MIGGWYERQYAEHGTALVTWLSAAAHIAVVAALVSASGPKPPGEVPPDFRPVFYLPPPERPVTGFGGTERISYVALGGGGTGQGPAAAPASEGDPARLALADREAAGEEVTAPPAAAAEDDEPVYTVVEVHEEAVRVANSAAPAYPPQLLADGVEGSVVVRYVVDANGVPDLNSFRIVSATRREFAEAVRAALPYMRFTPARIDDQPVRQLVEQPFTFRIQRRTPADSAANETARANP